MSENLSSTEQQTVESGTTVAKPLAPEDVQCGDYVAILRVMAEVPSFLWCTDAATEPRDRLVRLHYLPTGEGAPMRVEAVCLPFVLVREPEGDHWTLDLRRHHVARLDAEYGKTAWAAFENTKTKRRKKKK